MKKKIKAISVKTLPNGYELTFDGQKSSTGYFYFSSEELLEGFMLHIGLGMTESLKREEMDDFTKAVMHWNENSVCVKEIIRLTKEVQAITKKRNALAAQLISERNRYIELTTEAAKLSPIVANIQRYHRKPLTLKELGIASNDIIDTDTDEEE